MSDDLKPERARSHPVPFAIGIGLMMALLTVFVGMRWPVELSLWGVIFVVFAVWGSNWIRTPDFGAGVWTGLFLGLGAPILQTIFFGTFLANNPWYADDGMTRGVLFGIGMASVVAYAILLGLVQFGIQKVRSRGLRPVPPVPAHE